MKSLFKFFQKEGHGFSRVGAHQRGCGGSVYRLDSTDFHFCGKCNSSGSGQVPATRQSGKDRLASRAKKRANVQEVA